MKNDTLTKVEISLLIGAIVLVALLIVYYQDTIFSAPPAQEAVEFKLCCPAEVCYEATVVSQTDWLNRQEGVGFSLLDTRCSPDLAEVKSYAEHHRSHKHHVFIMRLNRVEDGIDFQGIDE